MKTSKCLKPTFRSSPGLVKWFNFAALGIAGLASVAAIRADILSWSGGGGANANWNDSANWGSVGTPVNGDTLIFPASQPNLLNTNNIVGLVINQIRFAGAGGGYVIRGNSFTVTNSIFATNSAGANTIENNITLGTANQIINVTASLTLSGTQTGGGNGFTKNGIGTLTLSGSLNNTYAGPTTVNAGILLLNKTASATAIPGNLDVFGTLRLQGNNQIADSADLNLESGGIFDTGVFFDGINTLRGLGNITFGAGGYLGAGNNNGSSTYDGVMSGVGFPGFTFANFGTGTITLNGNHTFTTGTLRALAGKLVINGFQPQIPTDAYTGGTIGGSGTIGTLQIIGASGVSPGSSPGVLTTSNLTLTSSSTFTVELTGPNPGTNGYDQLNVHGSNTLASAKLALVPAFVNPVGVGQTFAILNNDLSEPIAGTFSGLPEGSSINASNYTFTISYVGGTGNDVVLTLTNLPASSAGYVINPDGGDGNISPNDCKYLSLVISNNSGTPMTGISAALQTFTPNVAVTQPSSTFANVAANGTGTNQALFQISTTTNFVCGTNITLNLVVTTASHGTFLLPFVVPTGIPSTVPTSYSVSVVTNIPDVGTIESTNVVGGFAGQLVKVSVSLWLTHPIDSDLSISLISPTGTIVPLVAGTGAGANFGSACSPDSNRTTFDDSAATSITAGSSPFVGTFRPQGSLAAFNGGVANGNWRLRINDSIGGSVGALRCWTLNLFPLTCPTGGGKCELCPNVVIYGATGLGSPLQLNYGVINTGPSVCGIAKPCPGTFQNGPFPADIYTFRNGPSNACITVTVDNLSPVGAMLAYAYLGSFDLANTNRCVNYLADAGTVLDASHPSQAFGFNVASNATFVIDLLTEFQVYLPYRLTVSGGDCRPVLNITPAGPGSMKLDWTTAAANYRLESTNSLVVGATNWPSVTNIPTVINSRYTLTNNAPPGSKFYRLHKP